MYCFTVGDPKKIDPLLRLSKIDNIPVRKMGFREFIKTPEYPNFYPGGIVFRTMLEAQNYLRLNQIKGQVIHAVLANFDTEAQDYPDLGVENARYLIADHILVTLSEIYQQKEPDTPSNCTQEFNDEKDPLSSAISSFAE
jgi:hypothetical protein